MTKTCTKCNITKPLAGFYDQRDKRTGKTRKIARCKSCMIAAACERQRLNYATIIEGRSKQREYFREYQLNRKKPLREWIKKLKAETPCADCGRCYPPECIDFDHRDPSTKTRNVSSMIGASQSLEAIKAEIAKCDPVCANCHRIRTAKQLDWY
jgi:hypothetical protein